MVISSGTKGMGMISRREATIAPRSAPTLNVLAAATRTAATYITGAGKVFLMSDARPSPPASPRRAASSSTAAASGSDMGTVHNIAKRNWAPSWEYVPIPEGSSSAAPVMSPGPRWRSTPSRPRRRNRACTRRCRLLSADRLPRPAIADSVRPARTARQAAVLAEERDQTGPQQRHRPEQVHVEPGWAQKANAKSLIDDHRDQRHHSQQPRRMQRRRQQPLPWREGCSVGDQRHVLASTGGGQFEQDRHQHQAGAVRG